MLICYINMALFCEKKIFYRQQDAKRQTYTQGKDIKKTTTNFMNEGIKFLKNAKTLEQP